MSNYVSFISKNKVLLTILLFIIIIVAIIGIRKINLGGSFDVFTPNDSTYAQRLEEMNKDFPSKDQLMILLEMDEENMTFEAYDQIVRFNEYVSQQIDGSSLNGIITTTNSQNISEADFTKAKQMEKFLGDLAPISYVDGKTFYTVTLFSERTLTTEDIQAIESYLADNEITYAISGDSYVQLKIFDYILFILTRVPPLAILTLLIVFYFKLRTIKGTLLSVLPAALGAMWTMGLVGHMGQEVSIITVLAPIFALVIGSADGLHFITHIQEEQSMGKETQDVISHTLHMVGVPMIITTITSIVGFLALLVIDTNAIIELAIAASIGIFFAGIATWYVLPLILSTGMKLQYKHKETVDDQKGLKRFWGKPVWLIIAVVFLIFGLGGQEITQEFNMLSIYRPYTDVHQFSQRISEINGGALPIFIYGDIPRADQQTMIAEIMAYQDGLRELEEVGKVVSAVDFMAKASGSPMMANQDMTLLGEFVNIGSQKIRMMVFPVNHENDTLKAISDYVNAQSGQYQVYNFKETGMGFMMMELNEDMIFNQVSSSVLAVVLVFVLLLISLRHLKAALISIVPIILTLFMLFGVMGLANISLNLITCTIFSITIGVGIDYAIHFTSIWRLKVKEGMSAEDSADYAYRYTARPITANALGLSLGFTALMLSPLQIHVTVSILMWIAMISSVVFSLIILPTLLRRVR